MRQLLMQLIDRITTPIQERRSIAAVHHLAVQGVDPARLALTWEYQDEARGAEQDPDQPGCLVGYPRANPNVAVARIYPHRHRTGYTAELTGTESSPLHKGRPHRTVALAKRAVLRALVRNHEHRLAKERQQSLRAARHERFREDNQANS